MVPSVRCSIEIFLIPVMSLLLSTDNISFAEIFPSVIPESKLISSGVAEMVVVDG